MSAPYGPVCSGCAGDHNDAECPELADLQDELAWALESLDAFRVALDDNFAVDHRGRLINRPVEDVKLTGRELAEQLGDEPYKKARERRRGTR